MPNPHDPQFGGIDAGDGAAITHRASPTQNPDVFPQDIAETTLKRLNLLYELPLQFAQQSEIEPLCQLILHSVMRVIEGASRGTLLVYEPATGKLALRASIPEDAPSISRTLILRTALEQEAFVWTTEIEPETGFTASIRRHRIRSGIYAPLLFGGQVYGVIHVDNPSQRSAFTSDDLAFLVAVANYAGAALANRILIEEIAQNNQTLQNLMTNFSPKVRHKLLEKSRQGNLQPGGETSEVTILMSDFRGFTHVSANMAPEYVVLMLNEYFSVLAEIVFRYEGTIDKFIGDAILAVFGSPEPDADHAIHAASCALAMQKGIAQINHDRRRKGLVACELGIGLHSGPVLHGFIGAADRLEYTVIGDTVNMASRFCECTQGGQIAVSPATFHSLNGQFPGTCFVVAAKHAEEMEAYFLEC